MSDATGFRRCAFPHSLPSTFSNDELSRLAATLQEAADALLLFCRQHPTNEAANGNDDTCGMAGESRHRADPAGVTYSPEAVEDESIRMNIRPEETEYAQGKADEACYGREIRDETGYAEDSGTDASEGESPEASGLGANEYRQYRLASHVIREEQQLLKRFEAESLAQALHDIHADLHTTVYLMRGFEEGDDRDFHIHLIGEQLARSLDMLSMACSIMADYDLVDVTDAPRH